MDNNCLSMRMPGKNKGNRRAVVLCEIFKSGYNESQLTAVHYYYPNLDSVRLLPSPTQQ